MESNVLKKKEDFLFSDPERKAFTERVEYLIKVSGSASALAQKSGVSDATVRKWRDGKSDPSRSNLITLARVSGVSIAWLVAGEGPMVLQPQQSLEPAPQAPVLGQSGDGSLAKTDKELLQRIMLGIEEGLEATGHRVPADKKVELAFALYEIFSKSEAAPDTATILPFLKLA